MKSRLIGILDSGNRCSFSIVRAPLSTRHKGLWRLRCLAFDDVFPIVRQPDANTADEIRHIRFLLDDQFERLSAVGEGHQAFPIAKLVGSSNASRMPSWRKFTTGCQCSSRRKPIHLALSKGAAGTSGQPARGSQSREHEGVSCFNEGQYSTKSGEHADWDGLNAGYVWTLFRGDLNLLQFHPSNTADAPPSRR
jgi:hypothetical protein